jgi:hypothetical protein
VTSYSDKELNTFELAVCNNQGDLFEESQYDFGSDAYDFVTKFMNSDIAESMDKPISMCHTWGIKQIGETLLNTVEIKRHTGDEYIKRDALFWAGYLYRFWSLLKNESSARIIKEAPIEVVCGAYAGLHTLSPEEAIRMLKQRV